MAAAYTAWLPREAFGASGVEHLLSEVAQGWSHKWFVGRSVECRHDVVPSMGGDEIRYRVLEDGLAIGLANDPHLTIAGAMLGATIDRRKARPADIKLFDRLAAACIDDLCSRLTRAFKLGNDGRWREGRPGEGLPFDDARFNVLGFAGAAAPLITAFVALDLEVGLIKSGLPPTPESELKPLSAALAGQKVSLAAFLGRCDLTIADLSGLAEGDVVVLDRKLDSSLDLALDGKVKAGRCSIEQDGEQLQLKIVEPLNG